MIKLIQRMVYSKVYRNAVLLKVTPTHHATNTIAELSEMYAFPSAGNHSSTYRRLCCFVSQCGPALHTSNENVNKKMLTVGKLGTYLYVFVTLLCIYGLFEVTPEKHGRNFSTPITRTPTLVSVSPTHLHLYMYMGNRQLIWMCKRFYTANANFQDEKSSENRFFPSR